MWRTLCPFLMTDVPYHFHGDNLASKHLLNGRSLLSTCISIAASVNVVFNLSTLKLASDSVFSVLIECTISGQPLGIVVVGWNTFCHLTNSVRITEEHSFSTVILTVVCIGIRRCVFLVFSGSHCKRTIVLHQLHTSNILHLVFIECKMGDN